MGAVMANREVTNKLILAALNGMEAVEDDYGDRELLSAAFTITLRTVKHVIGKNELLRPVCLEAVQLLMMEVADKSHPQ